MDDEKYVFMNFRIFDYERRYNDIEFFVLSVLSFGLPLFIGHPQVLIGSLVNLMLSRAALSMKIRKALPIILLPSIGAYLGNVLFGESTSFLLYFIPVIWLANAIYVLMGKLVSHKMNKDLGMSVLIASLSKSSFLFISAIIAVVLFGFPEMFITAMGLLQLLTALIGGYSAYVLSKIETQLIGRSGSRS